MTYNGVCGKKGIALYIITRRGRQQKVSTQSGERRVCWDGRSAHFHSGRPNRDRRVAFAIIETEWLGEGLQTLG